MRPLTRWLTTGAALPPWPVLPVKERAVLPPLVSASVPAQPFVAQPGSAANAVPINSRNAAGEEGRETSRRPAHCRFSTITCRMSPIRTACDPKTQRQICVELFTFPERSRLSRPLFFSHWALSDSWWPSSCRADSHPQRTLSAAASSSNLHRCRRIYHCRRIYSISQLAPPAGSTPQVCWTNSRTREHRSSG